MSELVCDEYKRMASKPESSNTYNKSLKIMAEIAANKSQEMYKDYLRKTEPSSYVGVDPFAGAKPKAVTHPGNDLSGLGNGIPTRYPNPNDAALRPSHYGGANNTYEVFNVLEAWGLDKDFYLGNVIKYIARAGKKDPSKELEDLEKAEVYLKRRIAELKK
jgi:hypothetical protein